MNNQFNTGVKPGFYLAAAVESCPALNGFVERENYRYDGEMTASRTYFSDKKILTLKVSYFETLKKSQDSFKAEIKQLEHSSSHQSGNRWRTLACGELSLIWNTNNRWWNAAALQGAWQCHVEMEYRGYELEDSSGAITEQLISALCQGLPPQDGETAEINMVSGSAADHCKGVMALYLYKGVSALREDEFSEVVEKLGIRSGDLQQVIFMPTEASFLQQYAATIKLAAEQTGLTPEMIAAVILSEVRGLDQLAFTWESIKELTQVKDSDGWLIWAGKWLSWGVSGYVFNIALFGGVGWFLNRVQERFGIDETWRDWFLSFITDDVSMGLVQRQVSSLIKLRVHESFEELRELAESALRWELGKWLADNDKAILLAAHFIRRLADQAAAYAGPRENQLKRWSEKKACGQFNLGLFAQAASQWTPLHIAFIGWKYNTGHLDNLDEIPGRYVWGDMFLLSYRDILEARVFRQ